jgi:hypothetical protein
MDHEATTLPIFRVYVQVTTAKSLLLNNREVGMPNIKVTVELDDQNQDDLLAGNLDADMGWIVRGAVAEATGKEDRGPQWPERKGL